MSSTKLQPLPMVGLLSFCMSVHLCVFRIVCHVCVGTLRGQTRLSDPWNWLQVVLSHLAQGLRAEPGSSGEQQVLSPLSNPIAGLWKKKEDNVLERTVGCREDCWLSLKLCRMWGTGERRDGSKHEDHAWSLVDFEICKLTVPSSGPGESWRPRPR